MADKTTLMNMITMRISITRMGPEYTKTLGAVANASKAKTIMIVVTPES